MTVFHPPNDPKASNLPGCAPAPMPPVGTPTDEVNRMAELGAKPGQEIPRAEATTESAAAEHLRLAPTDSDPEVWHMFCELVERSTRPVNVDRIVAGVLNREQPPQTDPHQGRLAPKRKSGRRGWIVLAVSVAAGLLVAVAPLWHIGLPAKHLFVSFADLMNAIPPSEVGSPFTGPDQPQLGRLWIPVDDDFYTGQETPHTSLVGGTNQVVRSITPWYDQIDESLPALENDVYATTYEQNVSWDLMCAYGDLAMLNYELSREPL